MTNRFFEDGRSVLVCELLCMLRALESVEIMLASCGKSLVGAINVMMLFSYRTTPAFEIPVGALSKFTDDSVGRALRSWGSNWAAPASSVRPLRVST